MNKKLYIFSIDALQTCDLEYLSTKPNFKRVLDKALLVKNMREIYPTLTYPIHTTIVTGRYPKDHGIFHNQRPNITPEVPDWSIMGSDWFWYSDYIKCPSIVDAANAAGLNTVGVIWPVLAGQKPKHNLGQIWPVGNEDVRALFEKSCTKDMLDLYYDDFIKNFDWKNGNRDDCAIVASLDAISRFNPDLMLTHLVGVDHTRHMYGDKNLCVKMYLDRVDAYIGDVLKTLEENNLTDKANIVILGDHGHIDIHKKFNLNILFAKYGLIRLADDGSVMDYDAYSFSSGFSTQIILKNPDDKEMEEKVGRILGEIWDNYDEYISRVYTKDEVLAEEGLDGEFSYVLEGADHVIFDNSLTGDLVGVEKSNNGYHGMHGHHPTRGNKPPFIVFGPDVPEKKVIGSGNILDECPTFCKLLGVEMDNLEGKSLI